LASDELGIKSAAVRTTSASCVFSVTGASIIKEAF
jgi:hypothetical protein